MKKVLLIIFFASLFASNKLNMTVPIQSVFFVLALIKSDVLLLSAPGDIFPSPSKLVKGALIILSGFVLSLLLAMIAALTPINHLSPKLPTLIFLCFLVFYFVIATMRLRNTPCSVLRGVCVVCVVFTCFSLISPANALGDVSKAIAALFFVLLFILIHVLYFSRSRQKTLRE